ncbi:hypothetical protein [Labilithrix luteola]|uniref:hypothetical protein n=1 Tax=Labilithrix luteola TaxID=1391654 RepID=UPI00147432A1|nr:hypothetical protein [Labilithrix luteola]
MAFGVAVAPPVDRERASAKRATCATDTAAEAARLVCLRCWTPKSKTWTMYCVRS